MKAYVVFVVCMFVALPALAEKSWLDPTKEARPLKGEKVDCSRLAERLQKRQSQAATVADVAAISILYWKCGKPGEAAVIKAAESD